MEGEKVTAHYLNMMEKEYKEDLSKVLFATSLCSDDVNISTDFRKVLKRPFTMGGLGGLPYSGYTGMVAYGHHIPDQGSAYIFYGPHIGITDEGELGRMRRPGQSHITNSCGALMLALERLSEGDDEVYIPMSSEYDYQQTLLERSVMPYKQQILGASDPRKEITDVTYMVIDKLIHKYVRMAINEFCCENIYLLGGVIINTSPEHPDYVDVRNFEVIEKDKAGNLKTIVQEKNPVLTAI